MRPEETFQATPGLVSAVAFGDHGHELLVAADAGPTTAWLRVWRLGPHPRLVRTIHVHGFVTWATWSPDGRTLVATAESAGTPSGAQHGFVRAWDVSTGRPLWTTPVKRGSPEDVTFAPGGKTLAVSGYEMGAGVLDSSSGRVVSRMSVSGGLYTQGVAFSPDGTKLASTDWNGSLDLWNPKTGKRLATIPDPDHAVGQSVSWSPDGRTIALTDQSNTLRLFDVATRTEIGAAVPAPGRPAQRRPLCRIHAGRQERDRQQQHGPDVGRPGHAARMGGCGLPRRRPQPHPHRVERIPAGEAVPPVLPLTRGRPTSGPALLASAQLVGRPRGPASSHLTRRGGPCEPRGRDA